jgi:hypothetical protein
MADATVRVYVNERGVSVAPGSTALDAVRALLPDEAEAITAGTARLTDSRGLPVAADQPLVSGAIYRVVPVRERVALDAGEVPS